MATSYTEIYDNFLDRVTDYDFASFIDSEVENLLFGYMTKACTKFKRICKKDLSDRDDILVRFNTDLSDEEIDIIATGMVVEWLKPKYLYNEHMRNTLKDREYSTFANQNLLAEIRETYLTQKKEFESMMNLYSYVNGNIKEWRNE